MLKWLWFEVSILNMFLIKTLSNLVFSVPILGGKEASTP